VLVWRGGGGGRSGRNEVQTARLYLGGPALPPSTAGQCGGLICIDSTALGRWNTNAGDEGGADQIGLQGQERRGEERYGHCGFGCWTDRPAVGMGGTTNILAQITCNVITISCEVCVVLRV
jgi:hypothetical protein